MNTDMLVLCFSVCFALITAAKCEDVHHIPSTRHSFRKQTRTNRQLRHSSFKLPLAGKIFLAIKAKQREGLFCRV